MIIFILSLFGLSVILISITLILRLKDYFQSQKKEKLEKNWREDLLDILTGNKESEELLKKVDNKQQLYFIDYLFRYSLRIKGKELDTLSDLAEDYKDVLVKILDKGKPNYKIRAIITLDKLNIPGLEDKYLQLLDSSAPIVVLYSARALVKQANPIQKEHLEEILKIVPRYKNWSNRLLSNILAQAGPEWASFFRKKLQNEKINIKTRIVIGQTLIKINDIESADVAAKILESRQDRNLIKICLKIIANTGTPKHLEMTRKYARSEDPKLKAQAIEALGTIGEKEDIQHIKTEFLEQTNWVAIHSARALKEMKATDVLKELARIDNYKSQVALQVLN